MAAQSETAAPTSRLLRAMSSVFAMPTLDKMLGDRCPSTKVVSFIYFPAPLDIVQTRDMLIERLCKLKRYRCRLWLDPIQGVMHFVELPQAEFLAVLPKLIEERHDVKTQADIDFLVSQMFEETFDANLPMWRCFLLQNMANGQSCLMMVIDHVIADGMALVQTLMSLADPTDEPVPVPLRQPSKKKPATLGVRLRGLFKACWGPICGDQMPQDAMNRLKTKDNRKPGKTKAVAVTEVITLQEIRDIQAKFPESTVNDVLMTLTAMTLQEYFKRYEPETLQKKVRGNFPIDIRKVSGEDALSELYYGNRFSQGQLRFPLHLEDPVKIMTNIKDQLDVIKSSPEPLFRDALLQFLVTKSCLPRSVVLDLVLDAFGKITATLSNVPGPLGSIYIMGQEVTDLAFYAMAPIGLYFGIIQYKGNFKVGIAVDASCEPEPKRLAECWPVAFAKLQAAALKS